jgi:hypothetical protein
MSGPVLRTEASLIVVTIRGATPRATKFEMLRVSSLVVTTLGATPLVLPKFENATRSLFSCPRYEGQSRSRGAPSCTPKSGKALPAASVFFLVVRNTRGKAAHAAPSCSPKSGKALPSASVFWRAHAIS